MCDMFYFLEDVDIAHYADDSTPYCGNKNAQFFLSNLEQPSTILFEWLNNHCVKSARIRSFPGPYFSAFGVNTERYYVSLHKK